VKRFVRTLTPKRRAVGTFHCVSSHRTWRCVVGPGNCRFVEGGYVRFVLNGDASGISSCHNDGIDADGNREWRSFTRVVREVEFHRLRNGEAPDFIEIERAVEACRGSGIELADVERVLFDIP
jgi:hypothetical protein